MRIHCRWIYGKHPTDEMLKSYIAGGYMYYAEGEDDLLAAVALTPFQTKDYHPVNWSIGLKDNEVLVVYQVRCAKLVCC